MRVTCSLCQFEVSGACQKKSRKNKPATVKLEKRRNCSLFVEDTLKVFSKFKKSQAHRSNIRKIQIKSSSVRGEG